LVAAPPVPVECLRSPFAAQCLRSQFALVAAPPAPLWSQGGSLLVAVHGVAPEETQSHTAAVTAAGGHFPAVLFPLTIIPVRKQAPVLSLLYT